MHKNEIEREINDIRGLKEHQKCYRKIKIHIGGNAEQN